MKSFKAIFLLPFTIFFLTTIVFTSCSKDEIINLPTEHKQEQEVTNAKTYLAALLDDTKDPEETRSIYQQLNATELIKAHQLIIESAIQQEEEEGDGIGVRFFKNNQDNFTALFNNLEAKSMEKFGLNSNQIDEAQHEELFETEMAKISFIAMAEEDSAVEARACNRNNAFPHVICAGAGYQGSNWSYAGTHSSKPWWSACDWVFNFGGNLYKKVKSNNSYINWHINNWGCGMRAKYSGPAGAFNTELILGKTRFIGMTRSFVQARLLMGF
ncbi:MAG: hypothetical protein AB8G15_03650 [Saprospiraceae bacterium]